MGAEYIIQEKASGVKLGTLWYQWPREAKLKLITQVVDIEKALMKIPFSKLGSVYFKEDLRSLAGNAQDLEGISEYLERFAIGPLTSTDLWTDAGKDMKIDRGPC